MSVVKETYATSELTDILHITRQALEKRAGKESWPVEARQGQGGGYAYPYATLPAEVKAAIARHEAEKMPQKCLDNQAIPKWSHKIGLARYQIIAAWRKYRQKMKVGKTESTAAFLQAYNAGLLVEGAFAAIGEIKRSTLYRWDKLLKENGDDYYALCDQRGKWNKGGAKGLGQLTPEAEAAFLAAWLKPNLPSVTLAHRCMEIALEKIGQTAPSRRTTYRFANRFEDSHHDVYTLMREGEKALNDNVSNYIRRDRTILNVGDCLFADGHTLNYECLHPVTGKPFRPTMILWFDWKSGMPVGWEFMPTENTVAISSSLRMAIRHLGMVNKVAYLDNGKAFKSKYFTNTDPDLEMLSGLYARLGIATQFATPYRGQVKIVERFFGTFDQQFAKLMPSYVGRNIDEKPAWRKRNEKFHQGRHEKEAMIPTLREAGEIFSAYVNWFADNMTHPDEQRFTCGEIFKAGQGPGVNLPELDQHFLWTEEIAPRRSGFTLAGLRYESDSLYGLNHKVIGKFSWADLSTVYLYTLNGKSLGTARPQVAVHPLARVFGTEHDQAMVADQNRRIAHQKKATIQEARALVGVLDHEEGQNALPYSYKPTRIEQTMIEGPAEPALNAEETARLEALADEALERNRNPKANKPKMFDCKFDHYDWLFQATLSDGYEPDAEEIAFMREYEASREYQESAKPRYDQIRQSYGDSLPQVLRQGHDNGKSCQPSLENGAAHVDDQS